MVFSHRTAGFSLIWALILGALLMLMGASIVRSAAVTTRSSAAITRATVRDVVSLNATTYAQRLLEANAAAAFQTAPVFTPGDGQSITAVQAALQAVANTWCDRDPDGKGTGRVRVYFTATACGQPLPPGVTLAAAQRIDTPSAVNVSLPFIIAVPGSVTPITGSLDAWSGSPSVTAYALLAPGPLNLGQITVNGRVHTDSTLTLTNPDTITGAVSASHCAVPSPACSGTPGLNVGVFTPSMSIIPTPAHPLGTTATVTYGAPSETTTLLSNPDVPVTITAETITLGVYGDRSQSIRACLGSCTTYRKVGNTLTQLDGDMTTWTDWSGHLNVISPTGTLTVEPQDADAPSIASTLLISTPGTLRVGGNLTYTQTSCAAEVCNTSSNAEHLTLQGSTITAAPGTQRIHASLQASTFDHSAPLTIFGSVIAQPSGTAAMTILQDDRVLQAPPVIGVPRLSPRWRFITIDADI